MLTLWMGLVEDMSVFFNNLGVSSAEMTFTGSFGVQGSVYDSVTYVSKFADPQYVLSKALAQIWAGIVFRLSDDVFLPLKLAPYGQALDLYLTTVRNLGQTYSISLDYSTLSSAIASFKSISARVDAGVNGLKSRGGYTASDVTVTNQMLYGVERMFTTFDGQRDRPWYESLLAFTVGFGTKKLTCS